jgi:hypothetical protein
MEIKTRVSLFLIFESSLRSTIDSMGR